MPQQRYESRHNGSTPRAGAAERAAVVQGSVMFCSPRPQFPICHTARQPPATPGLPPASSRCGLRRRCGDIARTLGGAAASRAPASGAPGSPAAAGWEMAVRSSSRWSAGWVTGAHPASRARQSPAAGAGIHKRRSGKAAEQRMGARSGSASPLCRTGGCTDQIEV